VQRDNIFVNIEHAELRMPRKEQIPSERFRRGDTTRAVIKSVEITAKGPDIIVSRADNHFLYKLFEMEVPEIEDGIIEITKIARHPGERAKIIVHSHDRRIDAVGACVGMRGSRIQAIVRELNNEKIDIVNHSEKPEVLITRALSPAKPLELHIDDDRNYCVALFDSEELETAIGKGGVNINLASRLIDYKIDAFTPDQYELYKRNQEIPLSTLSNLSKGVIRSLADVNINNVAELLNASEDRLLGAEKVTEDNLEDIYNAVKGYRELSVDDEAEEEQIEESKE
jgi:N utilization substance protein A